MLLGAASILRKPNLRVLVFGGPHYADSFPIFGAQLRAAAPKGPFAPSRHALGQWDTGRPCITMAVAGPHVYLLRAELKSRMWPRFNACITPIRPNIVGPLSSTSISVSIAACHSGKSACLFGRSGM